MQINRICRVSLAIIALCAVTDVTFAADCNRACLEGFVDRYLDAVIADQPGAVPLAPNVRFTEDGQQLVIGDGLWNTLRAKGRYRLFVSDVPAGQVAFFGTIEEDHRDPDKGTAALIALRLKVRNQQIAEIEQIVIRDENASKRVEALGAPNPLYAQPVPANERMSRADLISTANKYFSGMQQNDGKGDYPFAPDCNRIENGGQSTNAPTPAGEKRPDPRTSTGVFRPMDLPRAVPVWTPALRKQNPRQTIRGRGRRTWHRVRVRVL